MPTAESPRRFAALRACAALLTSGLVLGLAAPPAGAAPARAGSMPSDVSLTTSTVAETLDPTFIQEGMPTPHGGQLVAWGDPNYSKHFPSAMPDGVQVVAISTDGGQLLALRSDGRVDWEGAHLPDPPEGTTYTAVDARHSGGGRLLRSDGVVVSPDGQVVMMPPIGLTYTAISGDLALRSDGAVAPLDAPDAPCAAAREPGSGIRYTAVSAGSAGREWAALRNDGAVVFCRWGPVEFVARTVLPPSGTTFIGIDLAEDTLAAATADGRVLGYDGVVRAAAPTGRSIVSLTTSTSGGSAVLDDGSLISWGNGAEGLSQPAVPEGRDVFSAVSVTGSVTRWAIMVGDPIPVDLSVAAEELGGRIPRVTETVRFKVTAALADGRAVRGLVSMTSRAPDGQTAAVDLSAYSTHVAPAELEFSAREHAQLGSYDLEAVFSGTPYVTTSAATTIGFREPSPVVLTESGPATWHQWSDRTLCVRIAPEDQASSLWWPRYGQAVLRVEREGSLVRDHELSHGGYAAEVCLDDLNMGDEYSLEPGTYTAHFDYEGWSEIDSVSWSGQFVVLPQAATHIESDLPSSWHYGEKPDLVWVDVTSEGVVDPWSGGVELRYVSESGMCCGSTNDLNESGRAQLSISRGELSPGTHRLAVIYEGGNGFLPSRLERTVTVKPALFTTTPAPTITGTAKVGTKLTAVPGTWSPAPTTYRYAWKADGVVIDGATASTLTVPASAVGKKITVTVTGQREHYESSAATSAPTTAVAPGTFTAPRPTITGTAKVGKTLTVYRGSWSPSPSSVKYVWKANGVKIATRTTNKFVIPSSARGKTLTVTVVGYRAGYTTKYVGSFRTATVAPGTFTAPRPTITGTKRVGYTLTAYRGSWSPSPSSVKYVWKANGVKIATRTTTNKFVIPSSARGKTLTVTVVGYRAGYTTKYATSYRTATIR